MSLLSRLFGKQEPPRARVRICVECGMPVAEHKDWCAIRLGQLELDRRREAAAMLLVPDPPAK